jgi:hypothetical protein
VELDRDVQKLLSSPFGPDELDWKPQATKDGKALAVAYIDARAVMNRLDFAVGPGNWSFDWNAVGGDPKRIKGTLTVCGVSRSDAGEAEKEDEPVKSAVSDALKRCGVHFGVGRYLYYLGGVWAGYDQSRRRFTEQPQFHPDALTRALRICGVIDAPAAAASPPPESRGRRQARETMERAERPLMDPQPNGAAAAPQPPDEMKQRQIDRLKVSLAKVGLDACDGKTRGIVLMRIAQLALDEVIKVRDITQLSTADLQRIADWIGEQPDACRALRDAVQKEQAGEMIDEATALLNETADATLPAQARGA